MQFTNQEFFYEASGHFLCENVSIKDLPHTDIQQIIWEPLCHLDEGTILDCIWAVADSLARAANAPTDIAETKLKEEVKYDR